MLRVLILDDESIVVDTLAACLRLPGLELTTCREIEAAEALLRCFRFDVVITDLSVSHLGGLDGMRLVRFVTANFPDTAVYVLSGYVDQAVRDLCSVLGVTAVLEKSEGLSRLRGYLLDRRAALLPPGTAPAGEGEVQHVDLLEDFMAAHPIRAVLQPVIKLRDGGAPRFEVFGVESLARGPSRSVLGNPAVFLAYAAQKELLFEADMICVRAALAEVIHLGNRVTTFLNVQPRSLTNPEFAVRLCDEVRTVGMAEKDIVLELTEQQTIVNPRAFAATLQRLREGGFRIALDDFGEGSSNLNLFQDLHPDFLKISGTFCRGLAHDPFKQIIVQSTAEMAARAGTATVMEAVETAEDAEVLRLLGIDYAQGYFFLKPLPGRELAQLLRSDESSADRFGVLEPMGAAPSAL
ncbi:MAG TPA: EAL domain-containing response regulator [Thermoanaerobaculia bacterium]|jgi:EAL domain-containing protein (putative c-di-GMP-specific phosphodiesterase class I)|nr:EAL domain-containing response regulator [Thermoanaerobaculia bacterium]